nr:MAG TPA: hypothetical protein [Caudoviricetes sp.]
MVNNHINRIMTFPTKYSISHHNTKVKRYFEII